MAAAPRYDMTVNDTEVMIRITDTFSRAVRDAAAGFRAFNRSLVRLHWRWRFEEFHRIGMTRPDGRPRRTGHRHRGTVGWERRHG